MDYSIDLIQELDSISRIHYLKRDDIDEMMLEFARRLTTTLRIERMSVWLFNADKDKLVSMGEYDRRTKSFDKNTSLDKAKFPTYFKAIEENKILLVENVVTDEKTSELNPDYNIPFEVYSLMDIPLRISGELVGVMCFEKTGERKVFTSKDQAFAFSVSLVFASNLEARQRRALQHQLELGIAEKERLIKEINHRVKNNFSILLGLIRIAKQNSENGTIDAFIEEYEQQIFSILKIHELLMRSNNATLINITEYIEELAEQYQNSHTSLKGRFDIEIPEVNAEIATKTATHVGLIVSEIMINAFKYAVSESNENRMFIRLQNTDESAILTVGDSGSGFDFEKKLLGNSMGLPLIKDLANDADLDITFPRLGNSSYRIVIPKE